MIHAIFFDMNNVIENNEALSKEIVYVSASVAVKTGLYRKEEIAFARTKALHDFLVENFGDFPYEYHTLFWRELITQRYGKFSEPLLTKVYDEFIIEYLKRVSVYPDVLPVLLKLKEQYSLGIIANGNPRRCYRFLKKFKIYSFFSVVVISGETGFKKPEPFLFEYALKKLNCKPEQALMVGDRYDTDIKGAKNVGMHTVRINRGILKNGRPTNETEIPEFEIDTLEDLLEILAHLNQFK
jgi:HAD superfamily hydrolase (TIGR01549 family)